MTIHTNRQFNKRFAKLPHVLREQFKKRRDLFMAAPFHPLLNNHQLHGEYDGCRSINVTGDYRAIYAPQEGEAILFIAIGTHHELFGT